MIVHGFEKLSKEPSGRKMHKLLWYCLEFPHNAKEPLNCPESVKEVRALE